MSFLDRFRSRDVAGAATASADVQEARASVVVDPSIASLMEAINGGAPQSVTFREAMSLPAVFAANMFLSSTLASLPMQVMDRQSVGEPDVPVDHEVLPLLMRAANDDMTAYDVRQIAHGEQMGQGRGYMYIERDGAGRPINLFPMEHDRTTVRRTGSGRIYYQYGRPDGTQVQYASGDVVDLAFRRNADWISSVCPVMQCAGAIRQGLNAQGYALTVFGRNGVPPYVLEGPFSSGTSADRAAQDVHKATTKGAQDGRPILALPLGHKLSRLGDDPEKMQLTAVQVFVVQQVARIYGLPPVFLQELSTGTFANVEQQDLHLVKHTLGSRATQIAQAMSLKLFGRDSNFYIRFDVDALARGVLKDRVEAIARGIQSGQFTMNEGREMHGLSRVEGGDELFIQSGTVPVESTPPEAGQNGGQGDE